VSFSPGARTRIKFCGLTRAADIHAAVALGVDAIGFVFDPRSKRAIEPALAAQLKSAVPALVSRVALFRDTDPARIAAAIEALEPDLLQFHGNESADDCASWGRPYLKAVPMGAGVDLNQWFAAFSSARALLLDSHAPGALGGSGEAFDWSRIPSPLPAFWILAGGLHPGNVGEAVTMARPGAVDVSSGIEEAPGIKALDKMAAFVRAVRAADAANAGAAAAPSR